MSLNPTFSGEMQLAGWSESHTGGCKVTFWLPSPDDLAAFRTLTTRKGNTAGHRFMAALVEIGDDELPVQPKVTEQAQQTEPNATKIGPLAYWLVLRCNEPGFWMWLESLGYKCKSAQAAGIFVKSALKIESRKDIDGNPENEHLFHGLIRGPYAKWCAARGVTA